jgi:hypothetical protein
VEANQWLQRNRNLRGQALLDAAKQQPWDPSVQALVAVPDALAKLNQDITWTTDLGNAFLSQQADVMSAVQRMRARAEQNGRLASTPQQTVRTEEQGGQQVIVIQPANPEVIYVPSYDPVYIWGPPIYGYYPPLYYPYFGFGFGIGYDLGFCFDSWGGWGLWGWGPSWFGHSVFVNTIFFHRYGFHQHFRTGFRGRMAWVHDPGHRMHVPYGTAQVAARFGGRAVAPRNSFRAGYTGRSYGSFTGRSMQQGFRGSAPQAQRYQNPARQRYQTSQQFQSSSRQYRATPQAQRFQRHSQQRYQAPQQYRSAPQQYRDSPRVVPFGNRPQSQQRYQPSQQYRSAPQAYRTPQAQRFQSQSVPRYQAPQFRSAPQQYRAAPQQFRSAPQMSAPRFSAGGFSRGGSAGFSRGSGGFSRGGSAGFSRGGGGGSSSRGGGGGRRR